MPGTGSQLPARLDLPTLADMAAKAPDVLVVDVLNVVDAKRADLAPRSISTTTGSSSTGAAARAAATAFTVAPFTLGAAEARSASTWTTWSAAATFAVCPRARRAPESRTLGAIVATTRAVVTLVRAITHVRSLHQGPACIVPAT